MDYAYNTSRTIPAYDEDGEYYYYEQRQGSTGMNYQMYNILNELDNSYKKQSGSGITANINLQFKLTDWLAANAILSYSNSNTEISGYYGDKTYYVATLRESAYGEVPPSWSMLPYGGELSMDNTRSNSYTARLQLNANKYFGLDSQHNINAAAGFELSSTRYNEFSGTYRGYYDDRGKSFVSGISISDYPDYAAWAASNSPTITDNLTNVVSGYLSVSYSYKNYFTLNVNGRVDGSNKFGDQSNDKFLPIWSVSGNYNFSQHEKLKTDWIDNMALKVSYGYQGNMLDSESPVLLIQKDPMNSYYNENMASVATYPNPNLKWEKTNSFNVGLNFSFLEGKIQAQTEYYYKRTKDAFMTKEVASMNGVDSYTINGGDVENQGYNVDFTFLPLKRGDWYWSIATSFSQTFNKIMNDPDAQTYDYQDFLDGTALVQGEAVNTFYSYDFLGLSPVDGGPMFDDWEDHYEDLMGLSKYDTYTRVLKATGSREPTMAGGLNTTLRYKQFRFAASFAYSLGAKTRLFGMYGSGVSVGDLTIYDAAEIRPEHNMSRDYLNRWQHPGDEQFTNIPAIIGSGSTNYTKYLSHWSDRLIYDGQAVQPIATSYWDMYDYSDIRVVSANYLKLNTLTLSYELPERLIKRLAMSRLEVRLSGYNLFTVCAKELKGQTPQQGGFTTIQLSDRPSYSLGINVSF